MSNRYRLKSSSLKMERKDDGNADNMNSLRSQLEQTYLYEFQQVEDWSEDQMQACGDDCEECEIPDDCKTDVNLDVMAFLGIRRAEPLRVPSPKQIDRTSEWE